MYKANALEKGIFDKLPKQVKIHAKRYIGLDDILFTDRGIELEMGEGFKNEILVSIPSLDTIIANILNGEKPGRAPKIVDAIALPDAVLAELVSEKETDPAATPLVESEGDKAIAEFQRLSPEEQINLLAAAKGETLPAKKKPGRPAKAK